MRKGKYSEEQIIGFYQAGLSKHVVERVVQKAWFQ